MLKSLLLFLVFVISYKQRQSTKYGFIETHYDNEQNSYFRKLNISDFINLLTVVVLNSGIQNVISKKITNYYKLKK